MIRSNSVFHMSVRSITVCAAFYVTVFTGNAVSGVYESGRLAIGRTSVNCVKAPCPWRGIVNLGNSSRNSLDPLWTGNDLPVLNASDGDAHRIRAAWEKLECLVVDGTFDGQTLMVNRILGGCS